MTDERHFTVVLHGMQKVQAFVTVIAESEAEAMAIVSRQWREYPFKLEWEPWDEEHPENVFVDSVSEED
jgi:hypothetical protein